MTPKVILVIVGITLTGLAGIITAISTALFGT